jgi:hypothetical protein
LSRGAHILLLARTASGFFALDDRDGMMPASQNTKFTPIMTLGQGMSWIHGRRVGGNPRLASAGTRAGQSRAVRAIDAAHDQRSV